MITKAVDGEPRMLVGGVLRPARTGALYDIDPATEQILGHTADGGLPDVDEAVAAVGPFGG
jgi:aldehyde dehydrogenase (NAD+)